MLLSGSPPRAGHVCPPIDSIINGLETIKITDFMRISISVNYLTSRFLVDVYRYRSECYCFGPGS